MPEYLTFAMSASMGAMGAVTVGSRRPTWSRPARSAILGLLGACLGADRSDEDAHQALQRDYGVAVLVVREGSLLSDFHTVATPEGAKPGDYPTRAAELRAPKVGTMITHREYRTDPLMLVAVWARGAARWSIQDLAAQMLEPVFAPYWGRRSCPFSLPFGPQVKATDTPVAVLIDRRLHGPEVQFSFAPNSRVPSPYVAMDEEDALAAGLQPSRVEERRDNLLNRGKWLFGMRREAILYVPTLASQSL
ncbi:type I-E CRISPR-associated protein Cas5/CasD [Belnapia sp. T18]|uniref:Type I-E CRISPR-associated protein Cas5/CasD n=1 Tax=Belnapia arida TaxID=2804533 RepID=A0ABS1UCL2_9PROT|nr:type I-E CRISPR-associated protein Cas5/CasD [Belnapia arida]MBL6082426.1 type I-E CRISPR-associated protein Cas5/CasD [Belnapia arida]